MKPNTTTCPLLILWTALGLCLLPAHLAAQAESGRCDAKIVDDAGVFATPEDMSRIHSALAGLESTGADVRVRTFPNLRDKHTIDAVETDIESQCQSWTNPAFPNPSAGAGTVTRKNNLIVVMIARVGTRTYTLIRYGRHWRPMLDSHWARIEGESMNPRFVHGEFTAGVEAGLEDLTSTIKQYRPRTGTDLTPLWKILGYTLLLIGIAGIVWIILKVLHDYHSRRAARLEAQQGALIADQKVAALITAMADDMDTCVEPNLVRTYKSVCNSYTDMRRSPTGSPDNERLDTPQYRAIAEQFEKFERTLRTLGMPGKTQVQTHTAKPRYETASKHSPLRHHTPDSKAVENTVTETNTTIVNESFTPQYDYTVPPIVPVFVPYNTPTPTPFITPEPYTPPTPVPPDNSGSSDDSDNSGGGGGSTYVDTSPSSQSSYTPSPSSSTYSSGGGGDGGDGGSYGGDGGSSGDGGGDGGSSSCGDGG